MNSKASEAPGVGHRSGFVAVVGRPNVGKSTLMNQLLEQKIAIVTPRAQTTRTRQMGILTEDDYQMIFIDTPGIMKKAFHKLDEFMLSSAIEALDDADVVLWLVDMSRSPGANDRQIAEILRGLPADKPLILALNKLDITEAAEVLPHSEAYRELAPSADWLAFSALTGAGVDELRAMLVAALPEGPRFFPADQVTDIYVRTLAAELVREQILLQMRDEIPHAVAVEVEEFTERENGVVYIAANIVVERDGHKAMIIGRRGARIKTIGREARKEIQELVGGPVYLNLFVKVTPNWREKAGVLRRLGYAA